MYFQSYVFGYCSCIFILIVSNIVGFALIWERWFVWTTIVFVQLDWNHRYHLVSPLNLSQSIPIQISCQEKKKLCCLEEGMKSYHVQIGLLPNPRKRNSLHKPTMIWWDRRLPFDFQDIQGAGLSGRVKDHVLLMGFTVDCGQHWLGWRRHGRFTSKVV